MDEASRVVLQRLLDRQEIEECMSRYAHAIDRHDEALIADVYHPDALDHHGPFRGGVSDFVAWVNLLHAGKTRAHTHNITTHWCDIQGHRAFADTYVLFVLYLRDRETVMMGSGRYIDRLEQRNRRWKIAERRTITELRLECDAQMLARAPGGYPSGTWDRTDISYLRPLTLLPAPPRAVLEPTRAPTIPYESAALTKRGAAAVLFEHAARRAIKDCITQSIRGLDRADRDLALAQFAPGAAVQDGTFNGSAEQRIDALLASFERGDISVTHNLTSHTVELHGDSAAAETYVMCMRYKRERATVWVGGLRLLDRLTQRQDDWLIASRKVVADYEFEANGSLFQTDDRYLHGRRDRSDLSYERG